VISWSVRDVHDEICAAIDFLSVGDNCDDSDERSDYHSRARRHLARAQEISADLVDRLRSAEAALRDHQAAERALVARAPELVGQPSPSDPSTSIWQTAGEIC